MNAAPVQASSPAFLLVVLSGPDKGVSYRLVSQKVTVGRDQDNDIVLNDQRCSRHHCTLIIHNNQVYAKDLGSRSGIFINGKNSTKRLSDPTRPSRSATRFWLSNKRRRKNRNPRRSEVPRPRDLRARLRP
jgi:pSer/pThr/pTyr-binding forkhead associated (FHA) protein